MVYSVSHDSNMHFAARLYAATHAERTRYVPPPRQVEPVGNASPQHRDRRNNSGGGNVPSGYRGNGNGYSKPEDTGDSRLVSLTDTVTARVVIGGILDVEG